MEWELRLESRCKNRLYQGQIADGMTPGGDDAMNRAFACLDHETAIGGLWELYEQEESEEE